MKYDETNLDSLYIQNKYYKVYKTTPILQYSIILSDEVGDEGFEYADLIHILQDAVGENDLVSIILNNIGGSLASGISLINAIKTCRAQVDIFVTGECCSMAAILALSGNSLTMEENTQLMFHNFSSSSYGKANDMEASIKAGTRHYKHLLESICMPFLTPADIADLVKGEDKYFDSWDPKVQARIRKHYGNEV